LTELARRCWDLRVQPGHQTFYELFEVNRAATVEDEPIVALDVARLR
jgi:hypothetical protein